MQNSDAPPELFRMQLTESKNDRDAGFNECLESIGPQRRGERSEKLSWWI